MKKRSIIELTPLLDVILILIFAFLINMQGQSDSMEEKYDEQERKYELLQEQYDEIVAKNDKTQTENQILTTENMELGEKVASLTQQMGYEKVANSEEKETLDKAMEALSSITGVEGSELDDLLKKSPDARKALDEIMDADDVVLEMYKYNFVMNKFYFIDIELIGEENRVVINSNKTQIAISKDDNVDGDARKNKSLEIYDEIKELIDSRQGGAEMVTVTLIVRDPEVYQYAYEIAWDALRELELTASGYRLYKTNYTYTE